MLQTLLAVAGSWPNILYAAPLIVVISLAYGATRHEYVPAIIAHAIRSLIWMLCFMGIILAVIWLAGFFN